MSKLLIFLLIAVAVAGLAFWQWEKGTFSKDVLKLEILGPEEAQAGDEIEYTVKMKNNGKARLENSELVFSFPIDSIPSDGKPLADTQTIGDIYSGQEQSFTFKARLFGNQNETREVKAQVSYTPKNLKAEYKSETTLTTLIKSVPLTLDFDLPLKINPGEKIDFSLNYFSNLDYAMENLRVKVEYPGDFTFVSSNPKSKDQTQWDLKPLAQANGGRVEISGILDGKEGESKNFKAQIGLVKDDEFLVLKEAFQTVELSGASLYVSQTVNGSQNYSANPGEMLHYEIYFKNLGQKPIQKKFLVVKLGSDFFDLNSITSQQGTAGQGDSSILFDWKNVSALKFLDADEEGKVEFWVKTKEAVGGSGGGNSVLKDTVSLSDSEKTFEVKMNSLTELLQKILYQDEVFGNEGPVPPKVGEKTTFTVWWQVNNKLNTLKNAKVKMVLPVNVKPTGQFFPESSKFTYDSDSKEVVWNIGNIESDRQSSLSLHFQIEFTPIQSQQGKTPNLVAEAELTAEDSFTDDIIQRKAGTVNTLLPDDQNSIGGPVQ